jgi:protein arginine phosphatase
MCVETLNLSESETYDESITRAADCLNAGQLVIFPTETVYGIGVRADHPQGLQRLYEVKNRPADQPLTVHIPHRDRILDFIADPPPIALRLARKGWPGPLTLLISSPSPASEPITRSTGQDVVGALYHNGTVGLRCPAHAVARDLLSQVNGPVVAASANRAGHSPPGTLTQAVDEMGDSVDLALDGGPAQYDLASTIVRIGEKDFEIVREGVLDHRMLDDMATLNILFVCTGNTCRSPMALGFGKSLIASKLQCDVNQLAKRRISVTSAGTAAFAGAAVSPNAVAVLRERGIDISDHKTLPLTSDLVHRADYVFTMTRSHLERVANLSSSALQRLETLAGDGDIDDPIGGDVQAYRRCADQIAAAISDRLEEIVL